MKIDITGNPGTGNTYQEINIGYVQNYNPNATTIINNNYGDGTKSNSAPAQSSLSAIDKLTKKQEILDYVGNLKLYVSKEYKNRYESLWQSILTIPEVDSAVYVVGKQKDTTFNRNLIANLIYIMSEQGIYGDTNATTMTIALEGDKEHSVRAQLRTKPSDKEITNKVESILKS